MSWPKGSAGAASGTETVYASPGLTLKLPSLIVLRVCVTAPASSNCWMRERLISPSATLKKRSSRQPSCSAATTARRGSSEEDVSDIQAPVDPKSTVGYRVAKGLVIVLSALIILALIALVTGFVLKMMGKSTKVF